MKEIFHTPSNDFDPFVDIRKFNQMSASRVSQGLKFRWRASKCHEVLRTRRLKIAFVEERISLSDIAGNY
jgi:hypothetical protein